jgi:NAD(P)-dependent dehydrogenase (short-subunit alcohol dehydrogenase family)
MNDHAENQPMSGRVALVAGASKGIGAATAEAFAAAGAAVVLAARDTTALKAVADGIQARGGRALAVGADVTDVASMRDVVDRAVTVFGRLDAAFNNASAGPLPAPLADIDPDEFDLGIATNIRGTFLGMKFQIPAMLASGGGAIVNMASVAGLNATANLAAYVAGKSGIIGLTKVAALDYADQGIRANVVAPVDVDADAADGHIGRGGPDRALAVLGPVLVHHRDRHPRRRRAGRGEQAAADVPAGPADEGRPGPGRLAVLPGRVVFVAEVDDAEAVALGVGQHDEVRVVRKAVPVDAAGAERHQAVCLCLLLGRVGDVQVEVVPRVIIRRCLAELQRDHDPGSAGRFQHPGPAAENAAAHAIAERRAPELLGPGAIGNSQHHHAEREHRLSPFLPYRPFGFPSGRTGWPGSLGARA